MTFSIGSTAFTPEDFIKKCSTLSLVQAKQLWKTKFPKIDLEAVRTLATRSFSVGLEAALDAKEENITPQDIAKMYLKLGIANMALFQSLTSMLTDGPKEKRITSFLKELRNLTLFDIGLTFRQKVAAGNDISLDEKDSGYQTFKQSMIEAKEFIDQGGSTSGKTALHLALEKKHFNKAFILLIEGRANPLSSAKGITAVMLAENMLPELPEKLATLLFAEDLRKAAAIGDLPRVKKIVSSKKVDINAADPRTGRTALHEAANNLKGIADKYAIEDYLRKECKVDEHLRDKIGFTAAELAGNPCEFHEELIQPKEDLQKDLQYKNFIIQMANQELTEQKMCIVLVNDTLELEQYVLNNPLQNKIMFGVKTPNSLRTVKTQELHISPIYFERLDKVQHFVQIDSTSSHCYLIPKSTDPTIKQISFFSPFQRQVEGEGCFEDLIVLACKIANLSGFLKFCKANSKPALLDKPLTQSEDTYARTNQHKFNARSFSYAENLEYLGIVRKYLFQRQVKGQLIPFAKTPMTNIYMLTKLPSFVLLHVERYDAIRHLRQHQPESFLSRMSDFFQHGEKRDKTITNEMILQNLKNPEQCYDFKGINFAGRHTAWLAFFAGTHELAASNYLSDPLVFEYLTTLLSSLKTASEDKPTAEEINKVVSTVKDYTLTPNFRF